MKAEHLKEACEAVLPHAGPFLIHLSDQRFIYIEHQDFLWIIPGGRTIGVANHEGVVRLIDLIHVVSLQFNGGPP